MRMAGKDRTHDYGARWAYIRKHLKIVEQGILSQPTYTALQVFQRANNFFGKKVSVRGTFVSGGATGKTTYYFWTKAGKNIQCRYAQLSLEDKRTILMIPEGSQIFVRGVLNTPWGSNPNPYLELNYFRVEKLAPEKKPKPEPEK